MLEELGADDPYVKACLDGKTPEEAAKALLAGTKLADPAVRKQLVDGGEAAVAKSTDSFIVLARKLDPMIARDCASGRRTTSTASPSPPAKRSARRASPSTARTPTPTPPSPCASPTARSRATP